MIGRRAQHLRRRRWPMRSVLLTLAVLIAGSGAVVVRSVQERRWIRATILRAGVPHRVRVTAPATVQSALT